LVIVVGLCLCRAAAGATYYVSAVGSDRSEGRSADEPLRSVGEAARRVQEGDRILLRRGDVFRESASVGAPGIQIDAYGPADAGLPTIAGSVPVTGWRRREGAIYVAQTDADLGYLFVNGELMRMARYPNTGWLRTRMWREEGERGRRRRPRGNTTVVCPELRQHPRNVDDYWTGATIRWRHHSWWYETRPVIGYAASGELLCGDRSMSDIGPFEWDRKGWGFYLDGKLEELDAPGEWYHDREAGTVYLWAPGGADPNGLLVEGSVLSDGLSVSSGAVRNVCFRHQKDVGLGINGHCVVEHCLFEGIGCDATPSQDGGGEALSARWNTRDARVAHNIFRDNFNIAINWNEDPESDGSSVIERNVLERTGTVAGYGGSGAWHGVGICLANGSDVRIQYNRIEGTGYAGIILGHDGNFAERNVIRHAMSTMNDGGGIYTNCGHSVIRHNIILDTRGGMESSGTWATISHGIWPEFLGDFRESIIEGNTCAGCDGEGLFLPNNYECVVRDNVFYDNTRYQMLLTGWAGRPRTYGVEQNHLIAGNVLYAARPGQLCLFYDPRNDYGTLKDNYFCAPYTDEPIGVGRDWPGQVRGSDRTLTIQQWQERCEWADPDPKTELEKLDRPPTEGDPAGRSELFVNDTEEPRSIPLDGVYRDLDGNRVAGSIELAPFSSAVLILVSRD
jgi:parallel beta-helix repeat protein